jgi:hypothetical protein
LLGRAAAKKVQPRLSSIFGFLLLALALKINLHMHPLTKQKPALVMENQTQASTAECAPFHGAALLDHCNRTILRNSSASASESLGIG